MDSQRKIERTARIEAFTAAHPWRAAAGLGLVGTMAAVLVGLFAGAPLRLVVAAVAPVLLVAVLVLGCVFKQIGPQWQEHSERFEERRPGVARP